MTFIITLISILVERFFNWSHVRGWQWFLRYQAWLRTRLSGWSSVIVFLISVLPIVFVVGLINFSLSGWIFSFVKIVFDTVILLYCLGPVNFWAQMYQCLQELQGEDPRLAMERVQGLLNLPASQHAQAFHQQLTRALFVESNRRVFAVLFWFIALGPAGALLYRFIDLGRQDAIILKWQRILDWLPIRLYTLLFALGGHFTEVIKYWRHPVRQGLNTNETLLTECGMAALVVMESHTLPEGGILEKEALALIDRVFVIALVILAIVVIL